MSFKKYPATEWQMSEWGYASNAENYSSNILLVSTLDKPDYSIVESTFNALIRRHEALERLLS
jgi:hypothetical protein